MKKKFYTAVLFAITCIYVPFASALDLQLDGKLALVTGSTGGIGYGIARSLLNEGATVIINGRSQEGVAAAIDRLQKETGKTAIGFAGDMSTAADTARLAKTHPGVEILINNVGTATLNDFEKLTDEDWYFLFDLNVMSGVRLSRLYLPAMKQKN